MMSWSNRGRMPHERDGGRTTHCPDAGRLRYTDGVSHRDCVMSKPETSNPIAPAGADEPQTHHSIGSRIRNYFLTGLIVAGPVAITIWLIWSFVNWVDDLVRPLFPVAYRPETYLPIKIPGFGLVLVFVGLTLLGFFAANLVGRTLVDFGEGILGRMPIVRPLYKGLKQVFETLFSKSGTTFRTVGLVEFPAPGMWSLVFLSSAPGTDITDRLPSQEEHVSVFLPCTPNPTTGFFFYVPRRDVIDLDITVETAMTLLMSAGMAQASDDAQKKLTALADVARARATQRHSVEPAK
jgi:uncharacterized membrane protein